MLYCIIVVLGRKAYLPRRIHSPKHYIPNVTSNAMTITVEKNKQRVMSVILGQQSRLQLHHCIYGLYCRKGKAILLFLRKPVIIALGNCQRIVAFETNSNTCSLNIVGVCLGQSIFKCFPVFHLVSLRHNINGCATIAFLVLYPWDEVMRRVSVKSKKSAFASKGAG